MANAAALAPGRGSGGASHGQSGDTNGESPKARFEKMCREAALERAVERFEAEILDPEGPEMPAQILLLAGPFGPDEAEISGGRRAARYKEVAAELGVSESAVRVQVHRLRKRFGRILQEEVAASPRGRK